MIHRTLFSTLLLISSISAGAPDKPEWQIIKTKYPTTDVVVAGYNVEDFGAKGDGRKDCTKAFQTALDRMHEAGGGTVFVPEGRYLFKGNLKIPVAVTLRGEWNEPTRENPSVRGTILMPLAGKGDPDGTPFITVDYCAGIKDLNIWYPLQSHQNPDPYPWCLIQKGGDNATFENLTLVNPYQGIRIGPGGNELHLVRNVYGTPLKTGIQYDSTTDIGRLEKIRFSPRWWCLGGLPKSPRNLDWTMENGTAIHMLRSDWEYVADVEIEGYARGFMISEGVRGAANAQFYHLIIRNCATAMEVEKTNPFGMVFTECYFDGAQHGVLVDEKFDSALLFSTCIFSGKEALRSNGSGNILMEQCRVLSGNVVLDKGAHSILGSALKDKNSRIRIGEKVIGVVLAGNQYPNPLPMVQSEAPDGIVQQSDAPPGLNPIPDFHKTTRTQYVPAKPALEVVHPSGSDDAAAIQQALDNSARNGGGMVLLPGQDYLIKGRLSIPGGVELRGVHDVPHHTMGGGSVLHIYPPDDEPTIAMEANSGMRGLSFNYPEQRIEEVKEYPFLIQGRGENIYVINVNAANPFKFIDFMSHRCDRHFIDYPSGAPFKVGVAVGGGSRNGIVQNMQFNPHYWSRAPRRNPLYANKTDGGVSSGTGARFWTYQKENLDALVVGHTENQFLYQNFVFGSLYGIHFTQQNGEGAINCVSHGHGTDGSKISCYFEYGHGEISMVNTELVAMSSQNKTAILISDGFDSEATLINTMVWGNPDILADVGNGTLTLQNLHANHHGQGLLLTRGTLKAFNLSFNQQGSHLSASDGTTTEMGGFITTGPLKASGAFPPHVIERSAKKR
ncbi:Alginate lyase 7 [Pontiella desulfatans]|uniref:Alginate lyase 7 n=1 Tax=Pontiella desulfatans TaxID=2750659 RepID=A0A6C2TYR9_PONDE|nr:glycosyl hydrolase family 28-related protein [Pontiella desulfatans]VGO12830.1 Alginate lyase 7 [Pontiella desulfatans]